jgi:transcription elongation factor/antiterminator RfaH
VSLWSIALSISFARNSGEDIANAGGRETIAGVINSEQLSTSAPSAASANEAPTASGDRHGLVLEGEERWFLVHTFPKRELQAQMHLGAQGFRTYLPQYLKTVRHARQLRTARAPLFPRYLFVILDLGRHRWLSVRSTIGVSYLVGRDDKPAPVPAGVTEALIGQTDEANLMLFGDGLKVGQRVRIAHGPFADFVGTLERIDDAGRVRLLLDMMGSAIAITLPRSGILPAA